jgi:hypothetical protein
MKWRVLGLLLILSGFIMTYALQRFYDEAPRLIKIAIWVSSILPITAFYEGSMLLIYKDKRP